MDRWKLQISVEDMNGGEKSGGVSNKTYINKSMKLYTEDF